MDELIARSFRNWVSEAERTELEVWRSRSPANERYYHETVWLLSQVERSQRAEPVPPPPNVQKLISAGSRNRAASERRRGRMLRAGASVSALLCAALILLILGGTFEPNPPAVHLGSGEIVTGAEMTTVMLGDGTVVRMAPNSRLHLTGEPGEREVWLDGRAYFAVARHERSPFRIRTHSGDAVVLGTRFDLHARQDDLQLLVVDGSVQLAAKGRSLDIGAHQAARAAASTGPVLMELDEESLRSELEWVGNFLVFEGTRLDVVARDLSAHYGVPVEILDDELASETVRAVFSDQELEDVLDVICRAVAAHCVAHSERVTMSP